MTACSSDTTEGFCSVTDNRDGTAILTCPDGSRVIITTGAGPDTGVDLGDDTNPDTAGVGRDSTTDAPLLGCNEQKLVLQGSYTIENEIDAAELAPYSAVTGDLLVRATGMRELVLSDLCEIGGRAEIGGQDLVRISMPSLTTVGDQLEINGNASLTRIEVPSLQTLRRFSVESSQISDLELESLTTVEKSLVVSVNAALTTFSAPLLEDIGEYLAVEGNTALREFNLSSLVTIGIGLDFHDNPHLATCLVEALVDQLAARPVSIEIYNNDDEATCE